MPSVTVAGTLMTKRLKTMTVAFFLVRDLNVDKVINLTCITTGIPRWRRITIGEMQYRMQIAYVKSVLTF